MLLQGRCGTWSTCLKCALQTSSCFCFLFSTAVWILLVGLDTDKEIPSKKYTADSVGERVPWKGNVTQMCFHISVNRCWGRMEFMHLTDKRENGIRRQPEVDATEQNCPWLRMIFMRWGVIFHVPWWLLSCYCFPVNLPSTDNYIPHV